MIYGNNPTLGEQYGQDINMSQNIYNPPFNHNNEQANSYYSNYNQNNNFEYSAAQSYNKGDSSLKSIIDYKIFLNFFV